MEAPDGARCGPCESTDRHETPTPLIAASRAHPQAKLALFDIVILCDDSGSMAFGERIRTSCSMAVLTV
jgi:hypothetical protein